MWFEFLSANRRRLPMKTITVNPRFGRIENRRMMKAEACFANVDIEPEEINVNDTVAFVWEIV